MSKCHIVGNLMHWLITSFVSVKIIKQELCILCIFEAMHSFTRLYSLKGGGIKKIPLHQDAVTTRESFNQNDRQNI